MKLRLSARLFLAWRILRDVVTMADWQSTWEGERLSLYIADRRTLERLRGAL